MNKKILGQFFTENDFWLKRQVSDFIQATKASIAYDPFAGSGCIFKALQERKFSFKKYIGLDIDKSLGYPYNDSLLNIPPQKIPSSSPIHPIYPITLQHAKKSTKN